jgi:1-acyl-sn-glycerol-3-phosphate acyltransferase
MIWQILRVWISFILPGFYRRLQIKNAHSAKVKGPVIIAMNHPNSFTDPILFSMLVHPVRPKFLARGDAFKPGLATWFLEQIGIIPIFRIQDGGKEGLKKNEDAYRRVNEFLKKNAKVIIFAEGLCVQERRLRPLKKGVPRMIFGAYEYLQNDELTVLPVGVNYSQADKFQSDVFINVGEPIPVRDFWESYQTAPAKTLNQFLQVLEPRMKALITHINDPANDMAMVWLEMLAKAEKMAKKGYSRENLGQDFEVLNELTALLNQAAVQNPIALQDFKTQAPLYFESLRKEGLRDWLLDPSREKENDSWHFSIRCLLSVIGFPLFLLALITNYLPFVLTPKLTWKIIKTKEFFTSIATGIGMVVFLVWYLLLYVILKTALPINYWAPFFLLVFGLSAAFSSPYYRMLKKTLGGLRFRLKTTAVISLKNRRAELLALINKF